MLELGIHESHVWQTLGDCPCQPSSGTQLGCINVKSKGGRHLIWMDEILHWYTPMLFYIGLSFMVFDVNSSIVDEGPLVNTSFLYVGGQSIINWVPHNYFGVLMSFLELNHL